MTWDVLLIKMWSNDEIASSNLLSWPYIILVILPVVYWKNHE